MLGTILTSLIFFVSLIMVFLMMYKNGFFNYYSIIIFLFIMFTWVVPLIFYNNREDFGITQISASAWIIIGVSYYILQVFIRYVFVWFSNLLKSRKLVFTSLLIGYAPFLFLAIFLHNSGMFYILIICSSILSSTYGLSINYWAENTNNRKGYQINSLIYILPLMGMMISKLILPSIDLTSDSSWSTLFSLLASITLLAGIVLYFIPEKRIVQYHDINMGKEKIFKDFNWKIFIAYPILLGISSFIYTLAVSFNLFHFDSSVNKNILPIIFIIIGFISFISAMLTGNYLIKKFGYMTLAISGLLITTIGIIGIFIMIIYNNNSWQWLLITILLFISGTTILQTLTLGDIVHISLKSSAYFLTSALAVMSICDAAGFLFSSLLELSQLNLMTAFSIIMGMITLLLLIYILTLWKHRELLVLMREKFLLYEYTEPINNNKK